MDSKKKEGVALTKVTRFSRIGKDRDRWDAKPLGRTTMKIDVAAGLKAGSS
jgi:hypothetical protein